MLLAAAPAFAQSASTSPFKCQDTFASAALPQQRTARNTICFDHYFLRPVGDLPSVVRVKNGEFFHVVIGNTDPTLFGYTITAVPKDESDTSTSGATGPAVRATRRQWTALTMRHTEAFVRYRVVIAVRADIAQRTKQQTTEQPPGKPATDQAGSGAGRTGRRPLVMDLHPATFDVWVETIPGIEVSFTGGVAFSNLKSPQFFVKTDDQGTDDANDDTATVEEDPEASDRFRPDTIAVTNIRNPNRFGGLGLAFGVGLNNDADPRWFAGPSYFLGNNVLLHGGWTGGRIDRLPTGQELGQAPILGDKTLTDLPKRFRHGFYVGISFAFVPKAKDNFVAAFSSSQEAVEEDTPETPAEEAAPAAAANAGWSGDYISGAKKVQATVDDAAKTVTLKGDDFDAPNGSVLKLPDNEQKTYSGTVKGKPMSCTLTESNGAKGIQCSGPDGTSPLTFTKK